MCATPGAIILAIPPGGAHKDVRRVAEERDRGKVGESPVFSSSLGWYSGISTKYGCVDEEKKGKNEVTYLLFIHNWNGHPSMTQLTEALGFLSAPVTAALACQHGGQGELVTLVAGVADAWAPGELCAHNLSVGDVRWWAAHNRCEQTKEMSFSSPTSLICSRYLGARHPTVLYLYREAWCRSRCGPWCRWGWRRGQRPSWSQENNERWRCGCRWSRFLPSARWLALQGRHSWWLHKQKRMNHAAATANRLSSYHIYRQTPTEFVLETFFFALSAEKIPRFLK